MTSTDSSDGDSTSTGQGPFAWLATLLRKMFGGASDSATVTPISMSVQDAEADVFVVAPGGYRIRVPKANDVHESIGEMLPSVREGLTLIPPLPHVVIELLKEIQNPNASGSSVAEIAANDPSLAASLLRTVNRATMGLQRKITSVAEAVTYLGFSSVKSMVLRLQLDETLGGKGKSNPDVEDLWIHSLVVSYIADALAQRVRHVDRGFVSTLALLHDIGKLILQTQFPQEAVKLRDPQLRAGCDDILAREVSVLGVDHAGMGANLAAKWGLPGDLVQAIRWHHVPHRSFDASDPIALRHGALLVQVANQLAKYCYVYSDDMEVQAVDKADLEALGLPTDITALLDKNVRAAANRAIFFADDGSTRPATTVRRFLRLNRGESAAQLLASLEGSTPGAGRVKFDDATCESLFASFEPGSATNYTMRANLRAVATAKGVAGLIADVAKAQSTQPISADARLAMGMTVRCALANAVEPDGAQAEVQIAHAIEGELAYFAVRAPSLAFVNRFKADCNAELALTALNAELANIVNLGWFDSIVTSTDGSTLVFAVRSPAGALALNQAA